MTLMFHTWNANQGQIVTYSYAVTGDGFAIERRYDASNGKLSFQIAEVDPDDDGDYWQSIPDTVTEFRDLTEEETKRYGLETNQKGTR